MTSKERFINTMNYQNVDRIPYFEEGIRDEVLDAWKINKKDILKRFPIDLREEIIPELDPIPKFKKWPNSENDLVDLQHRLNFNDPTRLPANWQKTINKSKTRDHLLILRVHRGFFLTMGIYEAKRFTDVLFMMMEKPHFVKQYMKIQGEFAALMAEKILREVKVDAVYFSEPIGSNEGSLISPQMYEEFVLESYKPLLNIIDKHEINTRIFLTYANAKVLIPCILKYGINCLWACEVDPTSMDYIKLRKEYGKELRLIGGIDLDALKKDKKAIYKEIYDKVPALLEEGGYVPLADGRVRKEVPFENYIYYRELLDKVINRG